MKVLSILLLIFVGQQAIAQRGTVRGKVLDYETGEELIGAFVYNQSKTQYRMAEMDGSFTLKLKPGKQYIKSEYPGYITDSVLVDVVANETISATIKLREKGLGPGITIIGKQDKKTETAVITEEKKAGTTTSQIGKQAMDKADVSTSDQAVSKTAGATVEDGKYVYVRGLSDRYSKTTINGAEVPGLDPNRNSVQMDLFPTSLLDKIAVYKSFSPDLPASFTGGLVDLQTRDFPESFMLSASIKFGFNTQSSFNQNFLGQETKGGLDFLGFDDGNRGVPANVLTYSTQQLNDLYLNDNETLNTLGKSFSRDFEPIRKTSLFNQSYSITIGNQIDPKDSTGTKQYPKIGYTAGISYRKNFSYYEGGEQGRYNLVGSVDVDETLNPELALQDSKGTEEVLWAALGNMSIKTNAYNTIGIMTARFQNGITSTRYLEGNNYNDANDLFFQTRTLQYQQRSLTTLQLKGNHVLGKKDTSKTPEAVINNANKIQMSWVGSYTLSQMETPELKFFTNDYTVDTTGGVADTTYDLQPQLYSDPSQFYRYMDETNLDIKINFQKPFKTFVDEKTGKGKDGYFKWGGSAVIKNRIFNERRFDFAQQSGNSLSYDGDVNAFMADASFDAGNFTDGYVYLQDASEKRNSYLGKETIFAVYGMADFYATEKLRLLVGARAELDSIYARSFSPALIDSVGGFNQLDILPSLNGTYLMKGDTLQLRFAYTRTLARPTFRELAPFSSFDFVGGNVYVGNKDLQRTIIDNIDTRLEWYPTASQKLSVGAFAKFFTNPIERAFNPEAVNAELTWRNVDKASAYGAEFDYSLKLDSIGDFFQYMSIGGNITYVYSQVRIPTKEYQVILAQNPNAENTRTMFGQAPYILNLRWGYDNIETGFAANINFGVSGKKLSVVTVGGTPNVFENARPNLGFNISKTFGEYEQWTVKFSALNLLNPEYKQLYEFNNQEYVFGSLTRGRTFNVGLKFNLDRKDRTQIDTDRKNAITDEN